MTDTALDVYYERSFDKLVSKDLTDTELLDIFDKLLPENQEGNWSEDDFYTIAGFVMNPTKPYLVDINRLNTLIDYVSDKGVNVETAKYLLKVNPNILKYTIPKHNKSEGFSYKELLEATLVGLSVLVGDNREAYFSDLFELRLRNPLEIKVIRGLSSSLLESTSIYLVDSEFSATKEVYNNESLLAGIDYLAVLRLVSGEEHTSKVIDVTDVEFLPSLIKLNELINVRSENKHLHDFSTSLRPYKFPFETVAEILNNNVTFGYTTKDLLAYGRIETAQVILDSFFPVTEKDSNFTKLFKGIGADTGIKQKLEDLVDRDDLNEIAISLIDASINALDHGHKVLDNIAQEASNQTFKELYENTKSDSLFEDMISEIAYPTTSKEFMEFTALNFVKYLYYR